MLSNHGSKDPDAVKLAKAYESNLRSYTIAFAEAGDGFVQRDKDAILTVFPYTYWINGVVSPRLLSAGALERVNEILAVFRKRGREVWFTLGPSTEPADLANTLKKRRLYNFHNRPFMACNLAALITGFSQPAGVSVHPVEDYDIFCQHSHPLLKRITTPRRRHIFQTFKHLAQEQPREHWMFIAERGNKPVGTAIIYIDRGRAGIYDVEVLEEFRGQGIGTALLQRVCTFAQEQGAEVAVLAASEQGVGFYARFGFKQTGRYPTYYYSIKKQKEDIKKMESA
jgi:ribosomal protein S18 acetylase RimI-like enzyme